MQETIYISTISRLFSQKERVLFFGRSQAAGAVSGVAFARASGCETERVKDLIEEAWDDLDEYTFLGSDVGWQNIQIENLTLADVKANGEYVVDEVERTIRLVPFISIFEARGATKVWHPKDAAVTVPWHDHGFGIDNVTKGASWHAFPRDEKNIWDAVAESFGWEDLSEAEISKTLTTLLLKKDPKFFDTGSRSLTKKQVATPWGKNDANPEHGRRLGSK